MSRGQEDIDPVAVTLALGAIGLQVARSTAARAGSTLRPVTRVVIDPPWMPERLRPGVWLRMLTEGGEAQASAFRAELARRLDELVPAVLAELLNRVDTTDLILRHVDLDRVVAAVDLDAAAGTLDLEAVLDRVDVDAVVRRADLEAVLDRLDLTGIVRERVDLDAVAAALDVDAVVRRADLEAVLDRLDLTAIVLQRVDLDAVVSAVLERLDLIALADDVIEGVDLPRIIRESTGSVASETVQGARMQGIAADEAVSRVVDRLLLRRRERTVQGSTAYTIGSGSQEAPHRDEDADGGPP